MSENKEKCGNQLQGTPKSTRSKTVTIAKEHEIFANSFDESHDITETDAGDDDERRDTCDDEREDSFVEQKGEATKLSKITATPAIFKRRQATKHLVVQSPTDNFFSPISQRLLQKKSAKQAELLNNSLID